jgi:hypothetical protein
LYGIRKRVEQRELQELVLQKGGVGVRCRERFRILNKGGGGIIWYD